MQQDRLTNSWMRQIQSHMPYVNLKIKGHRKSRDCDPGVPVSHWDSYLFLCSSSFHIANLTPSLPFQILSIQPGCGRVSYYSSHTYLTERLSQQMCRSLRRQPPLSPRPDPVHYSVPPPRFQGLHLRLNYLPRLRLPFALLICAALPLPRF